MSLTGTQRAALSIMQTEPLFLSSDWEADGHRRQLFFFTNASGEVRCRISDIAILGIRGLLDIIDNPKDPDALIAKITPRGLALTTKEIV